MEDAVAAILQSQGRPDVGSKCHCTRIVRNGQADGLQRFKCRSCGVTFNALTGTPRPDCGTATNGCCKPKS